VPRLERWSRDHAVVMLGTSAVSRLGHEGPWLVGIAAGASFALLIVRSAGEWTPDGRFGAANAVTCARLGLVLALNFAFTQAPGIALGVIVLLTLLLDGADGWLARRWGTSSAFGAHFDMEVDALLVLTTSLLLWMSKRCGAWVAIAGALRYLYVLCSAWWPPRGGPMPRTLLGRSAFALVVVGHALGLMLTGNAARLAAALGTAAVTLSFARSFWFGYGSSASSTADS